MCRFVFRCFLITTGLKLRHSVNLDSCVGVGTVRREGAFIFIRDDGERTAAATVESFRSKVATRRGERVCWFVPPFRWPHEGTTHRLSSSPARYARDKITLICIISVMWMVEKIVALMTEKDEIHLLSP